MGVDHGGGRKDKSPQNLERGDCSPRFCHVAKFLVPDYLLYNVGKCVFCLYSRTFIVSPAMRSSQNSSQIYAYAPDTVRSRKRRNKFDARITTLMDEKLAPE